MFNSRNCISMLNDLQAHKRDRESMMLEAINLRLETSYKTYCKELNTSLEYLERRNTLNVMKKINKAYK